MTDPRLALLVLAFALGGCAAPGPEEPVRAAVAGPVTPAVEVPNPFVCPGHAT